MEQEPEVKKEEKQPPPEPSRGGGRDKNKEEKAEKESSSSDSSECSDDSGPDEILIPEPGMSVWQYVCMKNLSAMTMRGGRFSFQNHV